MIRSLFARARVALFFALLGRTAAAQSSHELTVVPVIGGDSDVGFGGGYVASLAHVKEGVKPYLWRLDSAGAITARFRGTPALNYLDDSVGIEVPNALVKRLTFEGRATYTDEPNLDYYGVGNRSRIPATREPTDPYFDYRRVSASLDTLLRYGLTESFLVAWGLSYTHNVVRYAPSSRVAEDLRAPTGPIASLVRSAPRHESLQFSYGVEWDDRDHPVVTRKGQFHSLLVDVNPGGSSPFPFSWGRANLTLRAFVPLVEDRLTFAGRVVVDGLFGSPPFYELSRTRRTQAIGGGRGLRGVPAGRYHGMLKLFSNLELRSELFAFRALGKKNGFGVTGFLDTGRVVSHYEDEPELDGTELGLKVGAGAGVRVTAGSSFVVRADVAWSPDARPVGIYLLGGHPF